MDSPTKLLRVPIFAELDEAERNHLADLVNVRKASRKETVIHRGDDQHSMLFIADGNAQVSIANEDGKEVIIARLERGDIVGEISLLTDTPRSASVTALTDCEFYILGKAEFLRHIQKFSGLSLLLLKAFALRVRESSIQISDLALLDVYCRTARTLERLAEEQLVDGETVRVIEKRPTHQELASMVGTSREMVTRALKSLEKDGKIEVDGKQIKLPQRS